LADFGCEGGQGGVEQIGYLAKLGLCCDHWGTDEKMIASEYTYFTLEPPKDTDIVKWESNGRFTTLD